ncbi:MAG TPA: hypothetical protein VFW07_25240 [Parafilimonas sp.]|nr:hypothetical protein [Parafilimonas sp.]
MKKTKLIIAFSLFFFCTKAQDTIQLKSGKTLEGHILSFANKNVSIKIGNETSVYKLDEIKYIRYNGPVEKSNEAAPAFFPVKTGDNKKQNEQAEARPIKIEK